MKFKYQARTQSGEVKKGEIEATSKVSAIEMLHKSGLYPTSVTVSYTHLDVHIEPVENEVRVRVRVDGILYDTLKIPLGIHLSLIHILPQYEKMFAQEYEISALEQKVETMQTYYEEIRKSYEELENIGWNIAEQKISANFMEGPFFKYNMQTYLEGLVTRSGLYLNSVSIEGVSDTYEFKKGEQSGEDRTRAVSYTHLMPQNLLIIFAILLIIGNAPSNHETDCLNSCLLYTSRCV